MILLKLLLLTSTFLRISVIISTLIFRIRIDLHKYIYYIELYKAIKASKTSINVELVRLPDIYTLENLIFEYRSLRSIIITSRKDLRWSGIWGVDTIS